jgi:hypothetical protein
VTVYYRRFGPAGLLARHSPSEELLCNGIQVARSTEYLVKEGALEEKQHYLSLDFEVVRALTFFGLGLREFAEP